VLDGTMDLVMRLPNVQQGLSCMRELSGATGLVSLHSPASRHQFNAEFLALYTAYLLTVDQRHHAAFIHSLVMTQKCIACISS